MSTSALQVAGRVGRATATRAETSQIQWSWRLSVNPSRRQDSRSGPSLCQHLSVSGDCLLHARWQTSRTRRDRRKGQTMGSLHSGRPVAFDCSSNKHCSRRARSQCLDVPNLRFGYRGAARRSAFQATWEHLLPKTQLPREPLGCRRMFPLLCCCVFDWSHAHLHLSHGGGPKPETAPEQAPKPERTLDKNKQASVISG